MEAIEDRAYGALLGVFVADAFAAQTEFEREKTIARQHPHGLRNMDERPRHIGEAGMVTDDSEMAIMLARSIIESGGVESSDVRRGYVRWLDAGPSDIGITISQALRTGVLNPESQANGALMRVAPIGIAGAVLDEATILAYSDSDCAITHSHPVCRDANRLWALAIAKTVRDGLSREEVYEYLSEIAPRVTREQILLDTIQKAKREGPLSCDGWNQGWVVLAFHLALHTLLSAECFEEGVVAITMRGGDADTNAAIYGALAGAVEGSLSIPRRWVESLRPTRCLEDLLGAESRDLPQLGLKLVKGLLA